MTGASFIDLAIPTDASPKSVERHFRRLMATCPVSHEHARRDADLVSFSDGEDGGVVVSDASDGQILYAEEVAKCIATAASRVIRPGVRTAILLREDPGDEFGLRDDLWAGYAIERGAIHRMRSVIVVEQDGATVTQEEWLAGAAPKPRKGKAA